MANDRTTLPLPTPDQAALVLASMEEEAVILRSHAKAFPDICEVYLDLADAFESVAELVRTVSLTGPITSPI